MLDYRVKEDFAGLGRNLQLIGILLLLGMIPYIGFIFSFISFFITLSALAKINRIRNQLRDDDLYMARKLYILSYVVMIIGLIVVSVAIVVIAFTFDLFIYLATLLSILIFVPIVIASLIEYKAWSHFKDFFAKHPDYFPGTIGNDAVNGTDKIKTSIILNFIMLLVFICVLIVLFILVVVGSITLDDFFLMMVIGSLATDGVGIIISIYRALGYFKLGHLKELGAGYGATPQQYSQYQQPVQPQKPVPYQQPSHTPEPIKDQQAKFCPNCGSKHAVNASFCPACGEKLGQ